MKYNSITEAINDAIDKFKAGKNIDQILTYINNDYTGLQEWMYETEIHLCNEDFIWKQSIDDFFLINEDLSEYYDNPAEKLDYNIKEEVIWFIKHKLKSNDIEIESAYQACEVNGVTITGEYVIAGQGGTYINDLRIFSKMDDFFKFYKEKLILYTTDGELNIRTHTMDELIDLFEKLIRPRLKNYQ